MAVMLVRWAVILTVSIYASGVHGSVSPEKRSDFSMYDNQFYRVGDTQLDDEITDCALVEHQFKKGFIRLREYLERKRGCGRQGKLKNIEGIEKSTEDDVNNENIAEIAKSTTEDYNFKVPSPVPAVKKPPKPKTIPQVINTYQPPHKMAYVPRGYPVQATAAVHAVPAQQPAIQVAVPRNQAARPSLTDYEHKSQNLALSFKSNPQYTTNQPSTVEYNSMETQNTLPHMTSAFNKNDQYTRLASSYDHYNAQATQHDLLQTFYPETIQERSRTTATVAVGQPLYRQHTYTRTQASKSAQTAPNKVSLLLKNAMKNFDNAAVNKPFNVNTFHRPQAKQQLYNKTAVKPVNLDAESNPDENIDDAHADMRDPEKAADDKSGSESIDQKPAIEPGIDDEPENQTTNKPSTTPLGQRPGAALRPIKPDSNALNGFQKSVAQQVSVVKGIPTLVKRPQNTAAQAISGPAPDNLHHPSINLEVLKNKIMHSTNATFLRRMLTLIQKITHHKDYQKLQAPARSFVAQANTAVQALNKAYNEQASTSSVSQGTGNQLHGNDYVLRKKSAVQRLNTAYGDRAAISPSNLGTVNQLYGNDYALRKKSAVQMLNTAYNSRIAMLQGNQGTGNQLFGNNYELAKKFQIARNPYYQSYYQYRQPYYSNLQSMRYGLYNGNVP